MDVVKEGACDERGGGDQTEGRAWYGVGTDAAKDARVGKAETYINS